MLLVDYSKIKTTKFWKIWYLFDFLLFISFKIESVFVLIKKFFFPYHTAFRFYATIFKTIIIIDRIFASTCICLCLCVCVLVCFEKNMWGKRRTEREGERNKREQKILKLKKIGRCKLF